MQFALANRYCWPYASDFQSNLVMQRQRLDLGCRVQTKEWNVLNFLTLSFRHAIICMKCNKKKFIILSSIIFLKAGGEISVWHFVVWKKRFLLLRVSQKMTVLM